MDPCPLGRLMITLPFYRIPLSNRCIPEMPLFPPIKIKVLPFCQPLQNGGNRRRICNSCQWYVNHFRDLTKMVGSHLPVTCRGTDSHGGSAAKPLFFNLPVICRREEGERVHACPLARSRHLVSMSLVSKSGKFETKRWIGEPLVSKTANFETKLDEIGNRRKNGKKLRSQKAPGQFGAI